MTSLVEQNIAQEDAHRRAAPQSHLRPPLVISTVGFLFIVLTITYLVRNTSFGPFYDWPWAKLSHDRTKESIVLTKDNKVSLIILEEAVKYGAVCLDGSPPGYYLRPGYGSGVDNWIIYFQGGAWCYDAEACLQRSYTGLGSSKYWTASSPGLQGVLSSNPQVNPDFYNWNFVYLLYCDGASFTGNRPYPVTIAGRTLYMRGKLILDAIINDLLAQGMQTARRVLLTGTSAGGLAVMIHADSIRQKLPKYTYVHALSDSGFFVDTSSVSGEMLLRPKFHEMVHTHHSIPSLSRRCLHYKPQRDRWECIFPQEMLQFVRTPIFLLHSAYDNWQLINILGINCEVPRYGSIEPATLNKIKRRSAATHHLHKRSSTDTWHLHHIFSIYCKPAECTRREMKHILSYRRTMFEQIKPQLRLRSLGVYLTSCFEHSQSFYDDTWSGIKIKNVSISEAFSNWYFNRPGSHRHFDCHYSCNPTCSAVW